MTSDNKADGVAVIAPDRIWADTESMGWVEANDLESMRPTEAEYVRANLLPQWSTIETAPDGETVMCALKYGIGVVIAHFDDGDWFGDSGNNWTGKVTHWQPIPNPPVQP